MADQDFFDQEQSPEDLSLDAVIESAKAELGETEKPKEPFQPTLRRNMPTSPPTKSWRMRRGAAAAAATPIKVLLYVCCVLAASVLLAVFAWKCADEVCAFTAEDNVVTVTVPENAHHVPGDRHPHGEGLGALPLALQPLLHDSPALRIR